MKACAFVHFHISRRYRLIDPAATFLFMKTAKLNHTDGQVEKKHFQGVPKQTLFSYEKGTNGNIVGRKYFRLDEDQDIHSVEVTYTQITSPGPQ